MPRVLAVLSLACALVLSMGFEWEGRLDRLRRELTTADPAQRREVVERLAHYPAAEVRDALLSALTDRDPGVRAAAAEAAGRVRLVEAVPRLLDWLDDPDADVRAAAAQALGRIGERQALPNLVRVLGDANAGVRRAGVAALAQLGGDDVVVPLLGRLDDVDAQVRVDAATVLGRLHHPRAVVPLVGQARDDAPEVRSAVYLALGELGDARAVPALVQGTQDTAPEARLAAVSALGRVGSPEAVRPLLGLLTDPDPRLPTAVTSALGQIPGPAARDALVDALTEGRTLRPATRTLEERARRLARLGHDEELDGLVRALAASLEDGASASRISVIATTLTAIASVHGIAPAAPQLLATLEELEEPPRALLLALGASGAPEVLVPLLERLRSEDRELRASVLAALDAYFHRAPPDGRAADPLLAILGEVRPEERARVVGLLGQVGARRALGTLRALLRHPDGELRLAAVQAIGEIGDPEGGPALFELLSDRIPRLRFEAARALGAAGTGAVVDAFLDRLEQRQPIDRHAVLAGLAVALPAAELEGPRRERVWSVLLDLAQGRDGGLAARALDTIGAWAPDGAAARLAPLLRGAPARPTSEVVAVLAQLPQDEARSALGPLLDADAGVLLNTQAAWALGEVGGPEEAEALLRRAPSLRWPASAAAAFGLARLAARGALTSAAADELCRLGGGSPDPFVRANVAIALARLGAGPCDAGGPDPRRWLEPRHSTVVRAAAARWLAVAADAGAIAAPTVQATLEACAEDLLSPAVATVCGSPAFPDGEEVADIYAYAPDGETLWRRRLVALRLADGTVWLGHTDANGHLRLRSVPAGPLLLEDPTATPLEPWRTGIQRGTSPRRWYPAMLGATPRSPPR
ncbi:MAG: HEAT repeat domain-containing protein [Sandaracinaceae bacterium]